MDNREVTIHRKWRQLVHKTHDEDIQKQKTNKNTTQKTKKMSNTDPTKYRGCTQVLANGKQFLPLRRHPSCYSYSQDVFDITISKETHITIIHK